MFKNKTVSFVIHSLHVEIVESRQCDDACVMARRPKINFILVFSITSLAHLTGGVLEYEQVIKKRGRPLTI